MKKNSLDPDSVVVGSGFNEYGPETLMVTTKLAFFLLILNEDS